MANLKRIKRENIYIELLGEDKPRQVCLTMESISLLEEKYGSLNAALECFDGQKDVKSSDVVFFLYAGLVSFDENITEKYVARRMDARDLKYYLEVLAQVIQADVVDDTKVQNEENKNIDLDKEQNESPFQLIQCH